MSEFILGISAYYHDSAAAIIRDGEIIAAAHEERFTRKKHDDSFPVNAVKYVLDEAGVSYTDLSLVAFYDKPYLKFERLLETYHAMAPRGLKSFLTSMPIWLKEKLFMKKMLWQELKGLGSTKKIPIVFSEHHLSHAASAFYPSPFNEAAILTIDGVGEWATTTIGIGKGKDIQMLRELSFPHSLGLLYSAFTYYVGFKVNSGEYKLMGLAPYGNQADEQTKEFVRKIKEHLVDIRDDGSLLLNMEYFSFATGLRMCNDKKWHKLFGISRREIETPLEQSHMNMASAIQQVTEEIVLKLAATAKKITQSDNLVLAGGVALNCVANGKILEQGLFKKLWIQPASGDAGGSLGAALAAWHIHNAKPRHVKDGKDGMQGSYLGPEFSVKQILNVCKKHNAQYEFVQDRDELSKTVASLLAKGKIIGWFQGKMEFGPRALGNRSILGDPRNPEMQKILNLKIKFREGFRPFAPAVLEEDYHEYFNLNQPSPYMLLVAQVKPSRRNQNPENYSNMGMMERLYHLRSDVPSVTHVDFSARIQTVSKQTNPEFWTLINNFKMLTGYGVLVNTSFNVRGEPIVCTPDDAYRCFMRTAMDYLVMGNFILAKNEQQKTEDDLRWKEEFVLD